MTLWAHEPVDSSIGRVRITVTVEQELAADLELLAIARGTTPDNLVRGALRRTALLRTDLTVVSDDAIGELIAFQTELNGGGDAA